MAVHGSIGTAGLLTAAFVATACGADSHDRTGEEVLPDASAELRDAGDSGRPSPPMDPHEESSNFESEEHISGGATICQWGVSPEPFTLSSVQGSPRAAAIAVHASESRFGVGFAGDGACQDRAFVAELSGPPGSGEPEVGEAFDECSSIGQVAIAHNGAEWLIASIDDRMDQPEVWVQAIRPGGGSSPPQRITDSKGEKPEIALVVLAPDRAMVAWAERDSAERTASLWVRVLDAEGAPMGEAVNLEERAPAGDTDPSYASVSISPIGEDLVALAYMRIDVTVEAVLQVLDYDGEPVRDAWVLAEDASVAGGIDVAADETGGAAAYGRESGDARSELLFQPLDMDGLALPIDETADIGRLLPIPIAEGSVRDVSMTRMRGALAVVYRTSKTGTTETSEGSIQVRFMTPRGESTGIFVSTDAAPIGGKTAVRAFEGDVVFGWNDVDADGVRTLTVARLPCGGY